MSYILSNFLNSISRRVVGFVTQNSRQFHALPVTINGSCLTAPVGNQTVWSLNQIRGNYKTFRPNERYRIKKLGWRARMSKRSGRMIIMRRILKGRYVLTH